MGILSGCQSGRGLITGLFATAPGSTPAYSLAAIYDLLRGGGRTSASGVIVTREGALQYGPWYRGITTLSADVAGMPCVIYKRTPDRRGKVPDPDHPAYQLLMWEPSDYESAFPFVELITSHAVARGNGYAYIEQMEDGTPTALLPLDPDRITPVRKDGVVWYILDRESPTPTRYPADRILHIRGYGDDGLSGYKVFDIARQALGLAIAQANYSGQYFRNGARPATVLQAPVGVNVKAVGEILEGWDRMCGGQDNQHKTAILTQGITANVLSYSAEDSQLIESRAFSIREIALYIGIPPHKIGDSSRTSFSSLEQENRDYLSSSLSPWLKRWTQEIRRKLFTTAEKDGDTHVCEFDSSDLLRTDRAAQAQYNATSLGGAPWKTVNEVREEEGLEPIDGGDELAKPLNMSGPAAPIDQPGTDPGPTQKQAPQEEDPQSADAPGPSIRAGLIDALRAASRKLLAKDAAGVIRRINADARKASASSARYMTWLASLVADSRERVIEQLGPTIGVVEHLRGHKGTAEDAADMLLSAIRDGYEAVAETATPRMLASVVDALATKLEGALPLDFANHILGETP